MAGDPDAGLSLAEVAAAAYLNPAALPLEAFLDEVMGLLAQEPTPDEVLVEGVRMHHWAERDGTYAELVARRSQSLSTLPGR